MKLEKICEQVAAKILGKPGVLVERMVESNLDGLNVGKTYEVIGSHGNGIHIFVRGVGGITFNAISNTFRKVS